MQGRKIDPTRPEERRAWGATLGRAHRILRAGPPPHGAQGWHWVDADAPHLAVEPWVRDAYLAVAPLQPEEMAALPAFVRFRWAVQADYFARRVRDHALTGIDDSSGNAQGLADARRHLVPSC